MKLKGDEQVVLFIVIFFLGFIIRDFIEGNQVPLKEIITGLITLMAAYSGASYAFRLQNEKIERNTIKAQVSSSNRAIYTIYEIWNIQKQYQTEIVQPFRGRYDIWANMTPTIPGLHEVIKFDTDNLAFLLRSGKPEVYANLLLEEKRYRIALSVIEERSKLMFNGLFPKMEALGYKKGDKVDSTVLEPKLGPDLTTKLKDMTKSIVTIIDENIISLEDIYEELQNYLKEILPNEKFIKVEFKKPNDKKA